MTAMTRDELIEAIGQMTVLELVEFIEAFKARYNLVIEYLPIPGEPIVPTEVMVEQEEFSVKLASFGANKINVIKIVREVTSLGLKEAKEMVDKAPVMILEGVAKEKAEELKKKLTEAGAVVEVV